MLFAPARSVLVSVVCGHRIGSGMPVALQHSETRRFGGIASTVQARACTPGRTCLCAFWNSGAGRPGVAAAANALQDFCGDCRRLAVSQETVPADDPDRAVTALLHRRSAGGFLR